MERETRCVRIGQVTLGEGMPAICVPLMGADIQTLVSAAARAVKARCDVMELRFDSLSAAADVDLALEACSAVRACARDTALLFTMRTMRDGGAGETDAKRYAALLEAVISSGLIDGVDCELSAGDAVFTRVVRAAKAAGVRVVGSSHAFSEPENPAIGAEWMRRQQELGADICKAALMTNSAEKALETALMFERAGRSLRVPMIAIAMGPCGILTRMMGECIGSCLTFGTAGAQSAPGQIDAMELRAALETVHRAASGK